MVSDVALGDFVLHLDPAVRQAAALARRLEGLVPNRPKDDEATAVKQALTAADTSAQELILRPLCGNTFQTSASPRKRIRRVSTPFRMPPTP